MHQLTGTLTGVGHRWCLAHHQACGLVEVGKQWHPVAHENPVDRPGGLSAGDKAMRAGPHLRVWRRPMMRCSVRRGVWFGLVAGLLGRSVMGRPA